MSGQGAGTAGAMDDGVDLLALWDIVWRGKWLIVATTTVFSLASVAGAMLAEPMFRAEVVVREAAGSPMGGAAALSSQFGGLAGLAGISLGGGGAREGQTVMHSRTLTEEFIRRNGILEIFYDGTGIEPSMYYAVLDFKRSVLEIKDDARTGLTTIAITWNDPETAARWANGFVALVNEVVRERAIADAQRNIAYLNSQIEQTSVLELQKVMYNLIESETKTLMLASARSEYAFSVIDPAIVPESRISPRRTRMVIFGTALGGFFGVMLVFGLHFVRRLRQEAAARR